MRKYELLAGSYLREAMIQLQSRANLWVEPCYCEFNGVKLIANPGDSLETIEAPWLAHQAELERKRNERAELAKLKRDAKLAEMTGEGMVLDGNPPEYLDLTKCGKFSNKIKLALLTPEQLASLPKGSVLKNIFGEMGVVGVDYINTDTRGGFTAWGYECL